MSTEPFVGEVKLLGFSFAPLGYMTCQGQLLSIAQYTALFALIGTTYGGDGQTTFALPDLQGRVPNGQGQGPGLPYYTIGEEAGTNSVTLTAGNMPAHVHTLHSAKAQIRASSANANGGDPDGTFPAVTTLNTYADSPSPGVYTSNVITSGTTDVVGGSLPFSVQNPILCMNFSIAVEGIFPSRN